MAQEWKLRLRGPQGTPAELVLPAGGETSLADLAQLAGKATNVAAARLILRCGFPPRPIDHAGAKKDQSIATDGLLQNRDMLTIERKPAPDGTAGAAQQPAPAKKRKARGKGFSKAAGAGHQLGHATGGGTTVAPAEAAAASAAAAPARDGRVDPYAASPKKKRRTKMPGGGMRLGASDEDPAEAAAAQAAIDRRQRPAASAAPAAAAQDEPEEVPEEPATVDEILRAHGFGSIRGGHTLGGGSGQAAGDGASLGSAVNRTEAAQNAAAADLVDAVSRTSQRTVHRVLRHDLKNARELREQEAEAERRIAAALGGRCSFVSLQDGSMNMCVTYKVGPRKEKEESVQDIPRPLLKMVLEAVLNSQDAQARGNLRPLSMAQATPRVFWNVVRHGAVGPTVNFQQALAAIVPDPQWAEFWQQLDVRERTMSKRAKEAEANEQAVEEYFANDSD